MRLARAILFAKDFEGMLAFYRDSLGLTPVGGREISGWAELDAGGTRLALHAIPSEIADRINLQSPARPREETPIKLVFVVSDVSAERARLVSLGVCMSEVRSWGGCDGVDPEGNVFQIASA
jgi:hypothetical protein